MVLQIREIFHIFASELESYFVFEIKNILILI